MNSEIQTFTDKFIDSAAELLAERHRIHRASEVSLAPMLEEPAAAAVALHRILGRGRAEGVIARKGHRLLAFLLGTLHQSGPGSAGHVIVPYEAAVVSQDLGGNMYGELYSAVARRWVAERCYVHFISVLATDVVAIDAWFSLGFGQETTTAVRDTRTVPGREPPDIEIRRGQATDVDAIVQLEDGLRSYQRDSPMFRPYPPERRAGMPRLHEGLLAERGNAYWIAYRHGDPVAYQLFAPVPAGYPHLPQGCVCIEHAYTKEDDRNVGVATALLRRGMAWAREAGYEHCTTEWMSANRLAAHFWRAKGFRPTSYGLCRRVGDQIDETRQRWPEDA